MAYAAVASLAQTTNQILNHNQHSISLYQKQQITSIDKYAILLQAFLEDFRQKASSSLEARIRYVANEAEDIIEHFIWRQQFLSHYRSIVFIRRFGIFNYIPFCYDIQLRKVADKVDAIAWEVMDIKNSFRFDELQQLFDPPSSSTLAHSAGKYDDQMVGFEEDLLEIKARLCGESTKLEIIPIVGMGGMGKTTLARNAFDDPLILEYFDIRAWVTVSQNYTLREILTSMLDSMKVALKGEVIGLSEELMVKNVYQILKVRRYLIVMDDMWSVNAWDDVRMVFPDDGNGSRIMLTSRLSDVATYPDPHSRLHEMRFMDADQSWKLLRREVFVNEHFCPPELESIGKEIAKSCRGLPLAIVVIAGLLSAVNKTPTSWAEIAANVNSAVALEDGQFEKILSLSYRHLPYHLRSCFLYMGGFPEDYEIHVSKLIKLWIAEGFLKHLDGSRRSIEEVAEEHVEDLVRRSLVLTTKRKPNGKIKSCRLHDLVRDLCIRKAKLENFFVNYNLVMNESSSSLYNLLYRKRIKDQRRVSIAYEHLNCLANIHSSTIHTIMFFHCTVTSLESLINFRLLRVLALSNSVGNSLHSFNSEGVNMLPDQLFELIHLRYLSFNYPVHIPAAIRNLVNLQTLIIDPRKMWMSFLPDLLYLPLEILRMAQLRHLDCFSIWRTGFPLGEETSSEEEEEEEGEEEEEEENMWSEKSANAFYSIKVYWRRCSTFGLKNLQTLSIASRFIAKGVEKLIPNIKKLSIVHYEDENDIDLDNVVYLRKLENLKLHIHAGTCLRRMHIRALPPRLKKLTLIGCRLSMKAIGSLRYLQVLKLRDSAFDGGKWETHDGEFPELKFLLVEKSNLQHWITESSHFPRLKWLLLHRCRYLSEVPEGIGEIPTLELIEVENGNTSLVESAKRIQEEQELSGNDDLHVRCVNY